MFIVIFAFLAVAVVATTIGDYKKRQLELEPLKAAIERGQQLDPALIERLMARERVETNPLHLQTGGIIAIAAGVGVALFSWFLAAVKPKVLYPLLGSGSLIVCVGIGLLFAAYATKRHISSVRKSGQDA